LFDLKKVWLKQVVRCI